MTPAARRTLRLAVAAGLTPADWEALDREVGRIAGRRKERKG